MSPHPVRVTRGKLNDGREIIYFDDTEPYLSGEATRSLEDTRDLGQASSFSEARRDPLTGDWYVYAAHRNNRTFMPPADLNPLAPTKPGAFPTEIPADDYNVVVFENRFPSLSLHQDTAPLDPLLDGLVERMPAAARCEVICFTPQATGSFRDLPLERARTVMEAWAHRTAELSKLPGIRQVLPFENRGEEIGVTLQHPHGQIYSLPFLSPRAQRIQEQARAFGKPGALFDALLTAEENAQQRVIRRGEHFLVFVPAFAKWPVEAMIMPYRHVADIAELTDDERDELTELYLDLLRRFDHYFEGVDKTPYLSCWNQAPVGEGREYGRLHLQIFSLMRSSGRMKFLASTESGHGAWMSDTTPEAIAERLIAVGE
ncbi:galactose-1-phosphate uridylyltransferase [Corynebacterium tapiri]|uniref:Galactose-1-phosphate uridylyltransferase n=1 Tax=Corynebacterium tapiri TaxID=1448266 RepID=A0A5C4U5W3_9CORY|nr:galactose-1-phosphate uridylyltransferase [Corynebacterium tapiri]TNL99786.1 galactose-1-phosphate uridylyltransferase [Corynebacterium tapiri]